MYVLSETLHRDKNEILRETSDISFLTFANNLFLNLKTETVQNITMQIPKYNVKD